MRFLSSRSSKQRINKETQTLNETLHKMGLIDIFRIFHPNAEEYTFFSSAHRIFSRIDHILGHKSSLSRFKKTEIVSSIFFDHNAMGLEINYRKKTVNKHEDYLHFIHVSPSVQRILPTERWG